MFNNDSKLPWGISLLIIGILFLFRKMNIFSGAVDNFIFDWKNLLILLGVVFFIFSKKQNLGSIILISIGLLFYLKDLNLWSRLSDFIWPLILIVSGGILIYNVIINSNKQNKSELKIKKDENHQTNSSLTDTKKQ